MDSIPGKTDDQRHRITSQYTVQFRSNVWLNGTILDINGLQRRVSHSYISMYIIIYEFHNLTPI